MASIARPFASNDARRRARQRRALAVHGFLGLCHRGAVLTVDRWPDQVPVPVPSFCPRLQAEEPCAAPRSGQPTSGDPYRVSTVSTMWSQT
jgi:hypothetical protein